MNRFLSAIAAAFSVWHAVPALSETRLPENPIEDNSFLIEEAYNQEPGVVQHINVFQFDFDKHGWEYSFTQEWPLFSQDHQLSYTLPVARVTDPDETGLSDMLINYRYQVLSDDRVAVAPRFSLVLPTGDADDGLGNDVLGFQVNLPLSVVLNRVLVSHWNLGATYLPDAKGTDGKRESTTGINYGASLVYLSSQTFNVLVEFVGSSDESPSDGGTEREDSFLVNPGVRYAIDFDSGLQIVPGLSFPVGVGPSEGEYGFLVYLSFEHPFL